MPAAFDPPPRDVAQGRRWREAVLWLGFAALVLVGAATVLWPELTEEAAPGEPRPERDATQSEDAPAPE